MRDVVRADRVVRARVELVPESVPDEPALVFRGVVAGLGPLVARQDSQAAREPPGQLDVESVESRVGALLAPGGADGVEVGIEPQQPVPRSGRARMPAGCQHAVERVRHPVVQRLALGEVLGRHLVHVPPHSVGVLPPGVARVADVEDRAAAQFVLQVEAVALQVGRGILMRKRLNAQTRLRQKTVRTAGGLGEAVGEGVAQQVHRHLPLRVQDPRSGAVVSGHSRDAVVDEGLGVRDAESGAEHQLVRQLVAQADPRRPVLGVQAGEVPVGAVGKAETAAKIQARNLGVERAGG